MDVKDSFDLATGVFDFDLVRAFVVFLNSLDEDDEIVVENGVL